jgi:beta-lactamase class D
MRHLLFSLAVVLFLSSCAQTHVKDHPEWATYFADYGIKDGCFILRDHNHDNLHYYNKARCIRRFEPASTFKIFNSLVALETAVAPDEQLVIKWDSLHRREAWDKDMDMREAFKVSCVPYYQEIARRIGPTRMKHYIDTAHYGNMVIGGRIDSFWLNNTLQISADEQVGLLRRMYFYELPFSERTQRIVRSLMLREETPNYRLYYKTGTDVVNDSLLCWIVGFTEKVMHVKEMKESMNKSDVRNYPFFFAENFSIPVSDTANKDWMKIRIDILNNVLRDYGAE